MNNNNNEKKRRTAKDGPDIEGGSKIARKTAALVLQVWCGELHPSEAAAALEIGVPRYYQIEKKAYKGVIAACEPQEKKGRQKSEVKIIAELKTENAVLQRDLKRAQALARLSQKAGGVATVVAQAKKRTDKKGRKRRRPVNRALKVAKNLQKDIVDEVAAVPVNGVVNTLTTPNALAGTGG
jgi:hypothetical protein